MQSSALQKKLGGLWTTRDLVQKFRVTAMTIHQWRQARELPALVLEGTGRPAVRYVPDEVRSWAKKRNVPLHEASAP